MIDQNASSERETSENREPSHVGLSALLGDFLEHDPELEKRLRFELIAAGLRWNKSYAKFRDVDRRVLADNMQKRREGKAEMELTMLEKRQQPEREDNFQFGVGIGVGTLQHDCGGGHRVIRSTRTFGG